MHGYSSDAPDRSRMPLRLAALALGVTYASHLLFETLAVRLPFWVEMPSLGAFYGVFYATFDRWAWRTPVFGTRVSKIQDLRGTWVGAVRSNHNPDAPVPIVVRISQTWTRISVVAETGTSKSHSIAAAVITSHSAVPQLVYHYRNDPKPVVSLPTMESHQGTSSLWFTPDESVMEGDYYTGRGRGNHGLMRLLRVSSEHLTFQMAMHVAAETERSLEIGARLNPKW